MNLDWTWSDPRRLGTNHELHEEQYLMMLAVAVAANQIICLLVYVSFIVDLPGSWKYFLIACLVSLMAVAAGLALGGGDTKDCLYMAYALLNPGVMSLVGLVAVSCTGIQLYSVYCMSALAALIAAAMLLMVCRNKSAGWWQAASRRSSLVVLVLALPYCLSKVFEGPDAFNGAVLTSIYCAWVVRTVLLGMTLQRTKDNAAVTTLAISRDLIIYLKALVFDGAGSARQSGS